MTHLMTSEPSSHNLFLPEDYIRPDKSKQFMKLKEGENRFRIISRALLGWVMFGEDGPTRKPFMDNFTDEEIKELKPKKNDNGTIQHPKHFWVMFVWNYDTKSIKVLEITQAGIQKEMETYLKDEDFGSDPTKYDFVITREGTTKENTQYSTRAKPPKKLLKNVIDTILENQNHYYNNKL